MKKLIGLVLVTLMAVTNAYADYTVRIITDKVLPINKLYLIGINGNWDIGGSDSKEMSVVEEGVTTNTWSYTSGNNHAFKIVINHRNWDNIYSTDDISFVADDPSAENKVMTITLQYATVHVTAPACTDKVFLLGGWNDEKKWKNESSKAIECTLTETDSETGRPIFTGYIIRNYNVNFKCYNRVGSWDYEEAADDNGTDTEQHTGVPGNTANVQVDYWKQTAYTCPENIGDVTLTITAPEGTDKVYLVGSWETGWRMSEAIECNHVSGTTFSAVVPNIEEVEYKCYNRKQRNGRNYWGYVETHDNHEVANRTLRFVDGAEQSITIEDWMNKGWLESDFTVTITAPNCTNDVYLIGNWGFENGSSDTDNGHKWRTGDAVQATNLGDNVFQATIAATSATRFKCYNKADWAYVEKQADGSTDISQRTTAESSITVARWAQKDYNGCVTVTITTPPGTEEVWMTGASGADLGEWSLSNAKECTKIADRTFQYTITNISGDNVNFRCLNKNTSVGGQWIYEQNEGNWTVSKNDADTKAITIASWRTPYRVGYSDQIDNSETSTFYDGQSVDVILSGRTLRGGMYNTICLPFNLASLSGTPLEGVTLKSMINAVQVGDELQLVFDDAESIEAGKPYLINPGDDDIEYPVFSGVSISEDVTAQYDEAPGIRFHGILAPTQLPASKDYLFLSNNNTLTWPLNDGTSMPGMRAYFELVGSTNNAPVRRARIVDPSQVVTTIESIAEEPENEKFLENGTIVIRRDGKTYNVLGQQIR